LSSHDQDGFLTEYVGGDVGKLMVAAALQITSKGQPVVYYGEELGNSGKSSWTKNGEVVTEFGQNRDSMPWAKYESGDVATVALHDHYAKLLNIRAEYSKVFSNGTRAKVAGGNSDQFVVIERKYDGKFAYVGLNTATEVKQATFRVDYNAGTVLTDMYSGTEYLVNADMQVTVTIGSRDQGGTAILVEKQDTVAPVTTVKLTGTPGKEGWHTSNVTVDLASQDGISGVKETKYRINDGKWTSYTEVISLTEDGIYNIEYRSADNAGNMEDTRTTIVKVDRTGPVLKVIVDKPILTVPNHKMEKIRATLDSLDSVSGIDTIILESITVNEDNAVEGDIQEASYGTLDTEFSLRAERNGFNAEGRIYTITYLATDKAGNTVRETITVTVPRGKNKK
jgi:hypothetical protein